MNSPATKSGAVTAATAKQAQPRFILYSVEELESLPEPAWLIESVLPQGALAELYGKPGVGKSFLSLDWALSLAAGVPWLGHPLKQADVVYVSAEGGTGLKKRIAAWRTEHPEADLSRFRAILAPVDMLDPKDGKALVQVIKDAQCEPSLVVIDTLARCFGDGDENAAVDMNRFVAGTDWIRAKFPGATVLVIHHSGKKANQGDRGSNALRAAADTVMQLDRPGGKLLTLKCEKQKDWEPFDGLGLALLVVFLGDGDETSCVIAARKAGPISEQPWGNESDAKALDALRQVGSDGAAYKQWLEASSLPESTFKQARKRLVRDGSVQKKGNRYRIANTNEGQGQGQVESQPLALAS